MKTVGNKVRLSSSKFEDLVELFKTKDTKNEPQKQIYHLIFLSVSVHIAEGV